MPAIIVQPQEVTLSFELTPDVINFTVENVGPQGPKGADGVGTVISSETAPTTPSNGQMWIKPSTEELSVWSNGAWQAVVYKTELASETGAIAMTGGYF